MDWNELQSLTWPGYARKNGGKGIRNRVLVIYTVKCAEFVAQQIVAKSGSTNVELDRKSTRLNSSHPTTSRMPSSA